MFCHREFPTTSLNFSRPLNIFILMLDSIRNLFRSVDEIDGYFNCIIYCMFSRCESIDLFNVVVSIS